jgi:hypothetical protein
MTIRTRLQTSTRVAGLLVAAAIVLAAPYGAAAALRSGYFVSFSQMQRPLLFQRPADWNFTPEPALGPSRRP